MESLPGFFFAAFGSREDAVRWAIEAQEGLMDVAWAEDVLEQPGCEELEVAVTSGRGVGGEEADVVAVFRGPRARMGIHASGRVARSIHRSTGRAEYTGRVTNRTARIMSQAAPGQILASHEVVSAFFEEREASQRAGATASQSFCDLEADVRITGVGEAQLKGVAEPVRLFQVASEALAMRPMQMTKKSLKRRALQSLRTRKVG